MPRGGNSILRDHIEAHNQSSEISRSITVLHLNPRSLVPTSPVGAAYAEYTQFRHLIHCYAASLYTVMPPPNTAESHHPKSWQRRRHHPRRQFADSLLTAWMMPPS